MGTVAFFIVIIIPTVPSVLFLMLAVRVMMVPVRSVISVRTIASVLISIHPSVNLRRYKREKRWWREGEIRKKSHMLYGKVPFNNYSGPVVCVTMPWSCQRCGSGKRKSQDSSKQNNR